MHKLTERSFLVGSTVILLSIQLLIFGFSAVSCKPSSKEDKSCQELTSSFRQASELATATLLALLIPAPGVKVPFTKPSRKSKPDDSQPDDTNVKPNVKEG